MNLMTPEQVEARNARILGYFDHADDVYGPTMTTYDRSGEIRFFAASGNVGLVEALHGLSLVAHYVNPPLVSIVLGALVSDTTDVPEADPSSMPVLVVLDVPQDAPAAARIWEVAVDDMGIRHLDPAGPEAIPPCDCEDHDHDDHTLAASPLVRGFQSALSLPIHPAMTVEFRNVALAQIIRDKAITLHGEPLRDGE